jgi:hypothetical protein
VSIPQQGLEYEVLRSDRSVECPYRTDRTHSDSDSDFLTGLRLGIPIAVLLSAILIGLGCLVDDRTATNGCQF